MNDDLVSTISAECRTITKSLESVSDQLRRLFEEMERRGSNSEINSSHDQNLVRSDNERHIFKMRISKDEPNRSLISLAGDIRSISLVDFPESLARIVVDGDVVSFVHYDGTVSMKPVACLRDEERKLIEKKEQNDLLTGEFNSLGEQTDALQRRQSEKYSQLILKMEREFAAWRKQQLEQHQQLKSKMERESSAWREQKSDHYQEIKSKLERESATWREQQLEQHQHLKSKMERESLALGANNNPSSFNISDRSWMQDMILMVGNIQNLNRKRRESMTYGVDSNLNSTKISDRR